jgi:hypothetical protein
LIGKVVRDPAGRRAGRIEEARATNSPEGCFIAEYLLGRQGLMARLSIADASMLFLRPLGARRSGSGRRVPWDRMDLTDPKRPKLRCSIEELDAMQRSLPELPP